MPQLFTEEFARAVHRLRLIARQVPAGGRHGDHRSRSLGSGMEFRDFRSYVPGDDLRRVDWNLYRRSGRLFLRLFQEVEDLPVYVLLDVSDSMFFEAPPRADAARQMAACLAAVATNQHDRVTIYPFGADLVQPIPPARGQDGFRRLLAHLERLAPAGPTNLRASVRRFNAMKLRSGLVVLISDFFDPAGLEPALDGLRATQHRLVAVQVVRPSDADPGMQGDLRVVDCESGSGVDVAVTPAAQERYRRAYASFNERLLEFLARRRAAHMQLNADAPVLEQLNKLFIDGWLVV